MRTQVYFNKNGKLTTIAYYVINITVNEYETWSQYLIENKTLAPEIIGLLLGRSRIIEQVVKCEICKKEIDKTDYFEQLEPMYGSEVHKSCYMKRRNDE